MILKNIKQFLNICFCAIFLDKQCQRTQESEKIQFLGVHIL